MPYLFYVEPIAKLLTAHKLISGQWVDVGARQKDERARIEPFDAVELDLSEWWAGVADVPEEEDEPESPAPPSSESSGG